MAVEYAAHKIRVNAIAPGVVLTERVKKLLEGSKDIERSLNFGAGKRKGISLPAAKTPGMELAFLQRAAVAVNRNADRNTETRSLHGKRDP